MANLSSYVILKALKLVKCLQIQMYSDGKRRETRPGISSSPIPVFPQTFCKEYRYKQHQVEIQEQVKTIVIPDLVSSFFYPYQYIHYQISYLVCMCAV